VLTVLAAAVLSLQLERVQESLTGRHAVYRQVVDGLPLLGPASPETDGVVIVNGAVRRAKKSIVFDRPLEPYAEYRDAKSGELLKREALFWTAKARVFDVNPVAKLNDPSLQDRNNAADAVPAAAYRDADVQDPLASENAVIVDTEAPFTAHADPNGALLFDRSQPQFEDVNAWYAIDRTQRYIQSLGYVGARRIVAYAVPIDAHAAGGTDNSYYIASAVPRRGGLYFGDGGTDDAEDTDIVLHEFMHAVQDWIAPGAFGGEPHDQSRAMGEGYADYWAFSETYAGSARDAACIGDWDARCWLDDSSQACSYPAGSDCLRRTDSTKTMANYVDGNQSGTEHRNGEIWSAALRDIFLRAGKRITDQLVIESYFDTPPSPTFRVMAQKLIDADRLLTGGANATTICSAMTLRGILAAGECDRAPKGEITYFQSPTHGVAIPATASVTIAESRAVERLFVHVRAAHPARGELRITLTAPDGTSVVLQEPSLDITPDLDVTYTTDAFRGHGAAGTWRLRVDDVIPQVNAGTLLSFDLGVQFAGDVPLTSRPVASGERQHIAVAGHLNGANGAQFRTDLRLFNRGTTTARVTLVYGDFAAVKLEIEPGRTVAFDDVVAQLFQSVGTGAIEIQGDAAQLVVTSRTYTDGTYGQSIPAAFTHEAGRTLIAGWAEVDDAFRTNYGFTEVSGGSGSVTVTVRDARSGAVVLTRTHDVTPHMQNQFPLTGVRGDFVVSFDVAGSGNILGYTSVIDNRSNDPMYVPAVPPPPARTAYAPAIDSAGANGTHWTTEVRVTSPEVLGAAIVRGVAPGILALQLPAGVVAGSRTATGTYGQFIPFLDLSQAITRGDVPVLESSADNRTNIGVFSPNAATVQFTFFDAGGAQIGEVFVAVEPLQFAQFPFTTAVTNGRVHVESTAPVFAYVSVVDNHTGDPSFFLAR
jgi:hypothetical protein